MSQEFPLTVRPPALPSCLPTHLSICRGIRMPIAWNYRGTQWTGGDSLGFHLERALDVAGSPGTWLHVATLNGTAYARYTDPGLTADTKYWYRVQAFNWVGLRRFVIPSVSPLFRRAPPKIFPPRFKTQTCSGSTGVTRTATPLTWTDTRSNALPMLEACPERGPWSIPMPIALGMVTFDDTNVTANTTNWYRVKAYNVVEFPNLSVPLQVRVVLRLLPWLLQRVLRRSDPAQLVWLLLQLWLGAGI